MSEKCHRSSPKVFKSNQTKDNKDRRQNISQKDRLRTEQMEKNNAEDQSSEFVIQMPDSKCDDMVRMTMGSKGQKMPLILQQKSKSIFNENCKARQIVSMQEQIPKFSCKNFWVKGQMEKAHQETVEKFLGLNQDFKFKEIVTLDHKKNSLHSYGVLVFNNGLTVTLSSGFQMLFNTILNHNFWRITPKVAFSIDQSAQSLIYTSKVSGIVSQNDDADDRLKQVESYILSQKKTILTLLAVTGIQMDCQNQLMRQILKSKKKLKNQLEDLLNNYQQMESQVFKDAQSESQPRTIDQMAVESDGSGVLLFGKGTNNTIQQCQETESTPKKKTIEGGYFTIQNLDYKLSLNNQAPVIQNLCKKTLRDIRKIQDKSREQNQHKMRKQLQIVNSIKNKKYLINYYCQKTTDNIEYVLMERVEHSLQEYIYFFGDNLLVQHKVSIAKQIVEAVINLHDSGVVHRDIKPSNILIKDNLVEDTYGIKLIDFAESYSHRVKGYDGDYACSHPYSPLECNIKRSSSLEIAREGIENKEIDYWSVGLTIYEVFFRKLPISYSRPFFIDISTNWKTELLLTVNQRQKYGLALVEDIITLICIKMLKMPQDKRMKLPITKKILELLQEYVNSMLLMVEQLK